MKETTTVREWGHLPIGEEGVSEPTARRLLLLSERATRQLRVPQPVLARTTRPSLRAGQVVGVLAVPGASVEILPKIDRPDGAVRKALVHMLSVAYGLPVTDNARRVVLLYPWHPGLPAPGIYRRWCIAATSIAFDIATVDIGRPDSAPKALREIIEDPDSIEGGAGM